METRHKFKQQLCRLFRPSILLRNSCNYSTASSSIFSSSSATNTSSHRSLSTITTNDTPTSHDPFSFSSRMRPLDCNNCKPTKSSENDVVSVVENVNLRNNNNNKKKNEKEGTMCSPASPLPPSMKDFCIDYCGLNAMDVTKAEKVKISTTDVKKKKKKKKKVFLTNSYGFSSSSELFSSDEGNENVEETARFFSSRSFSSDSSEFYQKPWSRKNSKKKNKEGTNKSCSRRAPRRGLRAAHREGFRPVVSVEDEKDVDISGTGIPVMKSSRDPYDDFRKSMVEMIVERQIFGGKDLERLLHSYLSLNSHQHHSFILRAFADISQVLFGY